MAKRMSTTDAKNAVSDSRISRIIKSSLNKKHKVQLISRLLSSLVGGDCPIEPLALIMGRNNKLCLFQLLIIEDVVDLFPVTEMTDNPKKLDEGVVNILTRCQIIPTCLKILTVHSEYPWLFVREEFRRNNYVVRVCYSCLRIFCLISVDSRSRDDNAKLNFSNMNVVSILIKSAQVHNSMLIVFYSLWLLALIIRTFYFQIYFSSYINDMHCECLVDFIRDDLLRRKMRAWMKAGPNEYEKTSLHRHETTVPYNEHLFHLVYRAHNACLSNLFTISSKKTYIQSLLRKPETFNKLIDNAALIPMNMQDRIIVELTLNFLEAFAHENEADARKIFEHSKFLEFLKILIEHPVYIIGRSAIVLLNCFLTPNFNLKRVIAKDESFLKSLLFNCLSCEEEMRQTALITLSRITDKSIFKKVSQTGFTDLEWFQLSETSLQSEMTYMAFVSYTKELKKFNDKFDLNKKLESAQMKISVLESVEHLKFRGNELYKIGDYKNAIPVYSRALDSCFPLPLPFENDAINTYQLVNMSTALYSNRAQCHLHLRNFQFAVEDCTRAIVRRPYMEDSGNDKLLMKSVLRRSVAYFEMGKILESLRDAAFIRMCDKKNKDFNKHFQTVFKKYREDKGTFYVTERCVWCLESEWSKLKRCADCGEKYCSKECQAQAWDAGHKALCSVKNKVT